MEEIILPVNGAGQMECGIFYGRKDDEQISFGLLDSPLGVQGKS